MICLQMRYRGKTQRLWRSDAIEVIRYALFYSLNSIIHIYRKDFYLWVLQSENPKYLIGKWLADIVHISKIKHHFGKLFKSCQYTFRL